MNSPTTMRHIGIFIAMILTALVTGCSKDSKQSSAAAAKEPKTRDSDDDEKPSKKKSTADQTVAPKDEEEYEDFEDSTEDAELQLRKDCGLEKLAEADDDEEIFSTSLTSLPVKLARAGTMTISSTTVVTPVNSVSNTSGKAFGAYDGIVQDILDEDATGTTTKDALSVGEMMKLREDEEDWEDILCTVPAIKRLERKYPEFQTAVEFEPALPDGISPLAIAERYEAEKLTRTFSGITARITTNDDDLEDEIDDLNLDKNAIVGTVTIDEISETHQGQDGDGKPYSIKADRAYRITYSFGNPEITSALGLNPVMDVYITHKKRHLEAVVVDTKDDELEGPLVFLNH